MIQNFNDYLEENKDKILIGFCLELKFLQELIERNFDLFVSFIQDNSIFFDKLDIRDFTSGIENIKSFFLNFTDLIYNDIDNSNKYTKFHKDFY